MRLVADAKFGAARPGEPAHLHYDTRFIVVAPRGDRMDVEIDRRRQHDEVRDAALFARFAQRDTREVRVAVAVAAELQPRRRLYGIRCGTVGDAAMEAFAPVVAKLAGK